MMMDDWTTLNIKGDSNWSFLGGPWQQDDVGVIAAPLQRDPRKLVVGRVAPVHQFARCADWSRNDDDRIRGRVGRANKPVLDRLVAYRVRAPQLVRGSRVALVYASREHEDERQYPEADVLSAARSLLCASHRSSEGVVGPAPTVDFPTSRGPRPVRTREYYGTGRHTLSVIVRGPRWNLVAPFRPR